MTNYLPEIVIIQHGIIWPWPCNSHVDEFFMTVTQLNIM